MALVGYARDVIDFPVQAQVDQLKAKGCDPVWQDHEPYLALGIGYQLEQAIKHASGGGAVMVTNLPIIADSLVDLTRTLGEMRSVNTHLVCIGTLAIDTRGAAGWKIHDLLKTLVALEEGGRRRKPPAAIAADAPKRKPRGRKPKADINQAWELSQQGHKPDDIAAELKLSRATVYRYLKAANSGDTADLL